MNRKAPYFTGAFAFIIVLAAACTAPDYEFAPLEDAGTPDIEVPDSGPTGDDDDAGVDSGLPPGTPTDASIPTDASTFTFTSMASTGDFDADCKDYVASITGKGANGVLIEDDASKSHCFMFFFNASFGRNWSEASAMCASIKRGAQSAHLAVFPQQSELDAIFAGGITTSIAAWIGLRVKDGAPIGDKASWSWVTGDAFVADGWAPDHPKDKACVSFDGAKHWTDVDCSVAKGVLCEMDADTDSGK